jgi:hypothetical protein
MRRAGKHFRDNVVGYLGVFLALTGTAVALPGTNTVDSGDIINGEVKRPDIAGSAVNGARIADSSVATPDLSDGGVAGADLATGAVNAAKVADGSLGAADINSSQIQRRVTGTCTEPEGITSVGADGGVTCASPVFGIRLFPNAGSNEGIDFSGSGPGLALSTTCHIGALTLLLITNTGPNPARLDWFYSDGSEVFAGDASVAAGADFAFELDSRRIEGQFGFADETGVSTINLHALDGGAACETLGTLEWAR